MASNSKEENASGISPVDALFGKEDDNSLANGFRDKVAAIHSHFDRDRDGFLNHDELRGLQIITSGNDMHQGQYVMVCNSIGCNPSNGLSVEALKLVYAAEGSNIGKLHFALHIIVSLSIYPSERIWYSNLPTYVYTYKIIYIYMAIINERNTI